MRDELARRGRRLEYVTIGYNALEGVVSIGAGAIAGSIALVGFGVDSAIEVVSAAALLWRLRSGRTREEGERAEGVALRVVGACFLLLALWVSVDAGTALLRREPPRESVPGIVIAGLSVLVMPLLVRAKRRVAAGLHSEALRADARQTQLCAWLSAILLAGLGLNALLGWWWADPLAALAMTPIIASEGIEALRGRACEGCSCGVEASPELEGSRRRL